MSGHPPRRRLLVGRLHALGPAPLGYFVRDAERKFGIDLTGLLEEYAELASPQPVSKARQRLGEPQSKSAGFLAPRFNPPHAPKAVASREELHALLEGFLWQFTIKVHDGTGHALAGPVKESFACRDGARTVAADLAKVTRHKVRKARDLKNGDPEAFAAVKSGTTTLAKAATKAAKRNAFDPKKRFRPVHFGPINAPVSAALARLLEDEKATLRAWVLQHKDDGIPAVRNAFVTAIKIIDWHLPQANGRI